MHDDVFAGLRQHVKFVGIGPADTAGIGFHSPEVQVHALEYAGIAGMHFPVGFVERFLTFVKRVSVLHGELARAHHAEPGTHLVTEFRLNLVEVTGQLPVTVYFPAKDIGNYFLVRRPETEIAFMPVLDAQQFRAHLFPAFGFLPQLGGLHDWHRYFLSATRVQFFPCDRLDFANNTQPQRQPGIEPGGDRAHQAGAQHQPVARNFSLSRVFLERGYEQPTLPHGLVRS